MRSVDVLESAAGSSPGPATSSPKPFDQVLVTLTKREHIELRIQAKQWKSLPERAIARLELAEKRHPGVRKHSVITYEGYARRAVE